MLAVRLPDDLERKLDQLVAKTHRPKSYYVKRALTEFFEDQEDYLMAVSRYEEFLKSGEKALSLAEIKSKYDLDNA